MRNNNDEKNQIIEQRLIASSLSPEERIRFLANIIVDKIIEDQKKGKVFYRTINKK